MHTNLVRYVFIVAVSFRFGKHCCKLQAVVFPAVVHMCMVNIFCPEMGYIPFETEIFCYFLIACDYFVQFF